MTSSDTHTNKKRNVGLRFSFVHVVCLVVFDVDFEMHIKLDGFVFHLEIP